MQRRIQLALALQKGPDEPLSVWVRSFPAVPNMGYALLTVIFRHYRHKINPNEIIEGEHWVKVKPFEDEASLEELLHKKA